jgi:hypothetical protein
MKYLSSLAAKVRITLQLQCHSFPPPRNGAGRRHPPVGAPTCVAFSEIARSNQFTHRKGEGSRTGLAVNLKYLLLWTVCIVALAAVLLVHLNPRVANSKGAIAVLWGLFFLLVAAILLAVSVVGAINVL